MEFQLHGYRTDGLSRALYSLLNNVKYTIPEEVISDKIIKAKIKPIKTNYTIPDEVIKFDGTLNYVLLPNNIAMNNDRNNLILELLKQNKNEYCLVLSDRLEGLKYLKETLGCGVMIDGNMTTKKAKQERIEAIEKMRNKEEHFLFATFGLAKERT